jgi:hypothetical protein
VNHCFEIEDPPGVERMFIVLSRNPEDLYNLHQAIKAGQGGASEPVPSSQRAPVQMAMNRVDREVLRLAGDLQSRDLRVKKIAKPEAAGEPPNSVYVVNASTGAKPPADRVVTEIRIEHR